LRWLERKQEQDAALKGGATNAKSEDKCGAAAKGVCKTECSDLRFSGAQVVQRGERGGDGQGMFGGLFSGGDRSG
jgi:hypothetical protein